MKRLAIITTHPIQYNAPLFRLLSQRKRIAVKVFYTWGQSQNSVFDARFGLQRSWDIPLLEGYDYEFVSNISKRPDSNRFFGVINHGLIRQLKDEEYDSVLIYRWSLFSHLQILQSLGKKTQLFFRGDSHLQLKESIVKLQLKKLLLKLVYRKVKKAFYTGEFNKDYYLQLGFAKEQLQYAPHAIDNARFSANALEWEDRAAVERAATGIPVNATVFLFAGKFYSLKRLDLLINAFQQLEGNDFRLLMVGNGELEKKLKLQAGEDERIIFKSFQNQSDMPVIYRMGDVFVLPSSSETWGLGVNESMACGRPAIVSDACGCAPELIIEGKTGFVFKSGESNSLLDQMGKFKSRKKSAEMGRYALEHIQYFSLERIAIAIEEAIMDN